MIYQFRDEYAEFSNFHPCIVYHKGIKFPTVEHAYQAMKANDRKFWLMISTIPAKSAGLAKSFGNNVKARPDWDDVKLKIMEEILRKKFDQPKFKNKLLSTGDQPLIEGNWWHDNFYGNCTCGKRKECQKEGENHLGKILMKIREDIRCSESL